MPSPADISVIICTRNRPEHLRNALAAIFAAIPAETEVIVVDSASDGPETHEIAVAAGALYVRAGKGLSVARNAGIRTSARPLVIFTDDDCLPAPGWIERALSGFADPRNGAVTGRMLDHTAAEDEPYARASVYDRPLAGLDAGHGAVMAFRRELLLRLGGFDDIMGAGKHFAGAEDLDVFVRIIRGGARVVHDARCVVRHANTRIGDEYIALHRGYGLGLGALVGKWLQIDPVFGFRVAWRILGRTVLRIVRGAARGALPRHDVALLQGTLDGARATRRLPLVGERFAVPAEQADAAPGDDEPAVSVELLRILDETHVANSLQYEAMHIGAVLRLDGAPLTGADGLIDREAVLGAMKHALDRVPAMAHRMVRSPLGITAPAWVPVADLDISRHVFFRDEPVDADAIDPRRLMDGGRGLLARDRPLWDFTFTRLTDGDIAMGARMHHANGDAKWAFATLTAMTQAAAGPEQPPVAAPAVRAPRTRLSVPLLAARQWLAEQPSLRAGWHEYWRKSPVKRLKRVAGRNARPVKELFIRRRDLRSVYLPPTSTVSVELDASDAVRRAARLRGSLNDLLVAAAMHAVDDDDRGIDVLVPVSRRTAGDRSVRNHIAMVQVHGAPGTGFSERFASVRDQVRAYAKDGVAAHAGGGRAIGYATALAWADHERTFGGASIRSFTVLPAGDPRDELSVFGAVYNGRLMLTATTRAELDTPRRAARLRDVLTTAGERA